MSKLKVDGISVGSKTLLDLTYPVGSIYMSVNETNPATLFGGGWNQLTDRFLLGAGNTYTVNATGGEATHKLTANEIPAHKHLVQGNTGSGIVSGQIRVVKAVSNLESDNWFNHMPAPGKTTSFEDAFEGTDTASKFPGSSHHHYFSVNSENTGGSKAHNNLPPYLAVYMWQRTS